jgi:uncharacterized RDD family membrane protein YckC
MPSDNVAQRIEAVAIPGLLRRLAALFYDLLLLTAVLMLAALAALLGAHTMGVAAPAAGEHWFQLYLALVCYGFFGWFWTHGGQTLGMRAWRLRLQTMDGHGVTWSQVLIRVAVPLTLLGLGLLWLGQQPKTDNAAGHSVLQYAAALLPCGVSYAWIQIDRQRRSWNDIASKSRVVLLPRPPRKREQR